MKQGKNKKLKKIASDIWDLELRCQNGENISENLHKMTNMIEKLSLQDILLLANILESKGLQN